MELLDRVTVQYVLVPIVICAPYTCKWADPSFLASARFMGELRSGAATRPFNTATYMRQGDGYGGPSPLVFFLLTHRRGFGYVWTPLSCEVQNSKV